MKRVILILGVAVGLTGCGLFNNLDQSALTAATGSAITALTLTDAQVQQLCHDAIVQLDAKSQIAPANSAYTTRLNKLTKNWTAVGDVPLNFKVYITPDINAFASADGSVRVYSGLMDKMTDEELVAVLGHEIGHVAHTDSKDAMRNSYYELAARQGISSVGGVVGTLSNSLLGDLAVAYLDAQFSQKQESAADDYGFDFAIAQGYTPYAMYNSLNKLAQLSGQTGMSDKLTQMFSSHPDPVARATRMKTKAENYKK